MKFYAAMDIGGSNARLQLAGEKHDIIAEYTGVGATINVVGSEKFSQIIGSFVINSLKKHNFSARDCIGICVAASGVDQKSMELACKQIFEKLGFSSNKIIVINDCKVYLFQDNTPMAILTVGTGSVAFGRTYENNFIRCGGWGQLLSDEGSGFYIGMKILQAMGNYLDQRCHAPILWGLFKQELPTLSNTLAINDYAVANITNKPAIAKLALLLEKAVLLNDPVAIEILEKSVDAQFNIIKDLLKNMHIPENQKVTVLFWGSILTQSQIISEKLSNKVQKELPAVVEFPKMTALEAAMQMAWTI